jgi:hypothetical protein
MRLDSFNNSNNQYIHMARLTSCSQIEDVGYEGNRSGALNRKGHKHAFAATDLRPHAVSVSLIDSETLKQVRVEKNVSQLVKAWKVFMLSSGVVNSRNRKGLSRKIMLLRHTAVRVDQHLPKLLWRKLRCTSRSLGHSFLAVWKMIIPNGIEQSVTVQESRRNLSEEAWCTIVET